MKYTTSPTISSKGFGGLQAPELAKPLFFSQTLNFSDRSQTQK